MRLERADNVEDHTLPPGHLVRLSIEPNGQVLPNIHHQLQLTLRQSELNLLILALVRQVAVVGQEREGRQQVRVVERRG